jgi:cbb3-type cytochrome c oxidase subunit III
MIDTRILIGLLAVLIAVSGVVFIAIDDADRRVEFDEAFHGRSVENGAALFTEYCAECHGLHGEGTPRAPSLNSKQFFENRVDEVGFEGGLAAYIKLTVAGGRPVKSDQTYPENMPTWSKDFGGPLRNDQIDNVVAYVMNWEEGAPDVEAAAGAAPTPVPGDTPEERGANLFQGLGCVACHMINGEGGAVGPDLTNVYDKGEDYVKESILMPNAVITEGYQPNIMPQNFGERVSDQDLDDMVAYFKSVTEGQ